MATLATEGCVDGNFLSFYYKTHRFPDNKFSSKLVSVQYF